MCLYTNTYISCLQNTSPHWFQPLQEPADMLLLARKVCAVAEYTDRQFMRKTVFFQPRDSHRNLSAMLP